MYSFMYIIGVFYSNLSSVWMNGVMRLFYFFVLR